ncbi:tetratricopeptide repeat protein [Sphingomonas sp. NFR15]|uniref:tetratricopeptide repeat protein n=1 Tax=Sphingomonas sp. NFR15 TaxID=1566282 RepID=UPI0008859474|nr:tetratricopeptide repeat protein [Sphingomonas sp. NFR15]SDA31386.1 Tetratricopeptide repeat-containing protein [Sphingomonas sp. NFR15]
MPERRASFRIARRALVASGALAAVAGACVFALGTIAPARADAKHARGELAQSLTLLDAGNYSAARLHAQRAIKADPDWGLAHAVLARAYLALGDGISAEGELDRARDDGFDHDRAHQLYAHAALLEGDPDRALAEAAKAQPRFAGYALRVAALALAAKGHGPEGEALLDRLLDVNPNDGAAWADLGRIRFAAGNVAGAIDAAARAIKASPNDLAALTLRGELVRAQYGLVAALPWFEAALARDAYYYDALIDYAATLGDIGRYRDMLAATRKALDARPNDARAYYLQAVLAARAGHYDLARTVLARATGTLGDVPGVRLLGGMLAYQAGAYQQAIDQWSALASQQPMNLTAKRLLGLATLRAGDARGALTALRPAALRGDADSYTLTLAARAFEQSGERDWAAPYLDRSFWPARPGAAPFGTDDAPAALTAAAAAQPDEPVARLSAVRGLLETGDQKGALGEAQAITRILPGAPAAWLALGDTLAAMGRGVDAARAYTRAADIRFDEPTMLRMVDALERAGQRPAALDALTKFLSQNPQSIAGRRIAAHWQIAAGRYDDAIETLERLRGELGNRDAALLAELAVAYTGDGDAETGRSYARAAYALAPMNPAATDAYGWALYQLGKTALALQLFQKAVAIAPGDATLHWHLGQALGDLGRNGEAAAQIRAALADPGFGDRAAAMAALRLLGT